MRGYRPVIEADGILTDAASTPEGRLALAVVENCFVHTGQKLRLVARHIRSGKVKTWDKLKSGGDTYGITLLKLNEEKFWIHSNAFYAFSLVYVADFIAVHPDGFIAEIRKAYKDVLDRGWYEPSRPGPAYHINYKGQRVYDRDEAKNI